MRIETNLSIEQYHSGPGISKSDLDLIARSPAHYLTAKASPRKQTEAMGIGSAFHTLVLEPETFSDCFAIAPEGIDRRTKDGKETWARFEFAAGSKTVLKADVMSTISGMAEAIKAHPLARPLVTGGTAEQSIFWESPIVDGITCKCRPDYIKRLEGGRYVIVDLKSTEDARPSAFERSAWNYRYFVQAPYYWDGCVQAFGHAPDASLYVAVEKEPPYAVAVYEVSMEMLNAGREEYFRNLRTFKECKVSGIWPAYPVEIQKLLPPKWAA